MAGDRTMSADLKTEMREALAEMDTHARGLAEAKTRFMDARRAAVRATCGRELGSGEVIPAADTSTAAGLSEHAFFCALALRLAGLGLSGVVGNPAVARHVAHRYPRSKGADFVEAWVTRIERWVK